MMMDCQYVATQRGGVALVFEGHRYNKVRDGKDGTVYWRCSRDRQCPGRAVTVHSRIKKANNKHNHSPDNGMTPAKPILNSNSLMSNATGSNQNALAFDVAAALLRNHTANQSSPHLSNHLSNHLNHSNNHHATGNHSSPANSLKQNLTEATMAALLGTNLGGANSSSTAAAIASLLTQQQKHGGLFGKSGLNSLAGLSPLHATQNNKTNADYLTNHLNDKLNSPDGHKDGQQQQQQFKDNGQFRDNLLSTGSTNYLSNASSSSASSSPLISLCGQAASFQNPSNHQRPGQFNYNKPDFKPEYTTKHDYKQIDYHKLDLYGQFNSPNHGAAMPNPPSNQSPNLSSFSFDQFKSGNQNKNSNTPNDKSNASSKLNSSIPSALSYLNNLNSLNSSYNNLNNSLTNRLGSPDWLGRSAGHQLNSPLSQLSSNGQLNQLLAQFELERLAARSNDLSPSNKTVGAFPNGDEVRHKKFKPDTDSAKRDEEYRQLNGLLKKDSLEAMKKFGKTKLLNDENKKSEELLKNGALDDCEFDEDDENLDELDEKKELTGFLPDGSTSALDLIKLGGLLNNPTAIFETLNQLSLTNPQMASAFALSLLGQLDQNANLQTAGANLEHPEKAGGLPQEEVGHLPAGSRSQSDQLGYPNKCSSADEKTENKLKAIGQFLFLRRSTDSARHHLNGFLVSDFCMQLDFVFFFVLFFYRSSCFLF